jgi:hypothetical protein
MRWSLGTRFSSYQIAHISMNVTRGCECKCDTINMEVAVTWHPTESDSGEKEAFCANSTGPKNVDPRVVCDLWACILVPWFRGCGLKLSGPECGPLLGSCIHSNGPSFYTRTEMLLASWGKAGVSKRTFFFPCSYAEVTERCPKDGDFSYETSHSLNTAVQKSEIISSKPSCQTAQSAYCELKWWRNYRYSFP